MGKNGSNLTININRYNHGFVTSDFEKELHRFAKIGSISQRPSHRLKTLKKGDYVNINAMDGDRAWKHGKILQFDVKSGQIQVSYQIEDDNKEHHIWTHLDNMEEIDIIKNKI